MADQTISVYAAEDLWEAVEPNARIRFGDWNEIWPFYAKLSMRLWRQGVEVTAPKVAPRKGSAKAHYDLTTRTVHIPPFERGGAWALKMATAVHEFAHHLSPGEGHGPEFRQAMLTCLRALGWDADALEECYQKAGVTASSKGDKVVDLVTKMLNQADGAGTQEERIAFLEGAERVASKHSLDLALMRKRQADANEERSSRPITGKLYDLTPLPSTTMRNLAVELGSAIGRAHGTECIIRGRSQFITFMGFPEDVHMVELMLSRVLPMMFEDADTYLRSPEHRESGVAAVSARITFCKSYAREVGSRLKEAIQTTQDEAVHETEGQGEAPAGSTEIALQAKAVEVQDYVKYEFKRLGVRGSWSGSRTSNGSGSAHDSGRRAAREANLFGRKELT